MRIAFISDIHSNIYALEAVIRDIEAREVEKIYCLGDLVGYLPFPNEVIEFIRNGGICTVQGNYDQSVAEELLVCGCDYRDPRKMELASKSLIWTQENTTKENKEFLKALPEKIELEAEGYRVLMVHGSPRKNNEYLFEGSRELMEIVEGLDFDILVCGHTHIPYYKVLKGKHIINGGSVGKPKHLSPNATYVIVEILENNIKVQIIEVPYDYERCAKAVEDSLLPDEFARMIRKGTG